MSEVQIFIFRNSNIHIMLFVYITFYEVINIDYSLFVAGNLSIPQLYLHSSVFVDSRTLALGFNYYPLFNQFQGKLELILQSELIFDPDYRTRFDNQFLFQPGVRFAVDPDFFKIMVSYERNEFITFTFDLMF